MMRRDEVSRMTYCSPKLFERTQARTLISTGGLHFVIAVDGIRGIRGASGDFAAQPQTGYQGAECYR